MPGFSSVDDLVASITAGKSYRADFNKTNTAPAATAGRWYNLAYQAGTPADQIPGNLVRNWDFQGGSNGWTLSGGITYTAATHLLTKAGGGNDTATIPVQCTPGITYQVYCTFGTLTGSGNMTYTLGGTAGANITAAGTTVQDIVMGTSNANLVISIPSGITATTIDLVVVIKKLQFIPMSDTDLSGCGLYHGGDVSPETKHLINMGAWTQIAAGAPAVLMLVDMLGCYPSVDTKVSTLQDFDAALEKVSNGGFTGAITYWTAGTANWAAAGNKAARTANADVSTLSQMMPTTPKCPYTVVFTVSGRTAGGVTVSLGGTSGTQRVLDGTYTETIIPVNATGGLVFTPDATFDGDLDDVSVKATIPRYTSGDVIINGTFTGNINNWTAGSANWAASGDKARRTANADLSTLSQICPLTTGVAYTVTYTISNRSAGAVVVSLGGTAGTSRTIDGTYTEAITPANSTAGIVFTPDASFNGDIDTVSVTATPGAVAGAGVRMFLDLSKTDNGTGTPTMSVLYTNTTPTGSRTLGGSPAVLASAAQGHIYHSGVAAGSMGPFLPLQAGDSGITSVQSIQMSAASGSQGYSTLWLCRPLAALPIMTAFVASERDFLNQLPSLPRVYDGAHLAFIIFAGAAISNVTAYQGYCDFAWS